jgi:hypothetical protein
MESLLQATSAHFIPSQFNSKSVTVTPLATNLKDGDTASILHRRKKRKYGGRYVTICFPLDKDIWNRPIAPCPTLQTSPTIEYIIAHGRIWINGTRRWQTENVTDNVFHRTKIATPTFLSIQDTEKNIYMAESIRWHIMRGCPLQVYHCHLIDTHIPTHSDKIVFSFGGDTTHVPPMEEIDNVDDTIASVGEPVVESGNVSTKRRRTTTSDGKTTSDEKTTSDDITSDEKMTPEGSIKRMDKPLFISWTTRDGIEETTRKKIKFDELLKRMNHPMRLAWDVFEQNMFPEFVKSYIASVVPDPVFMEIV